MQSTKVLGSFKNLFVQPLPLNKRESEKLLKAITTSFRAQLDKEHGWEPESSQNELTALKSTPISKHDPHNPPSSSRTPNPPHRPVDRHLRAVLENPLFKHNGESQLVGPRPALQPTPAADPRAIFEAGVAKGLMTIPRAYGFLLKCKDLAVTQPAQSGPIAWHKAIGEYGAGLMVLNWLRASGQERDLAFLENRPFTRLLLKFMAAEGVDDLAWVWLERLSSPEGSSINSTPALWLLQALVKSKYADVVELDPAYKLMLQGDALFKKNGLDPVNLGYAWRSLAWETTVNSWRHTVPEENIYDAFLHILDYSPALMAYHAHLELHHPTKPSHERAVEYLLSRKPVSPSDNPMKRTPFLSLALDTCQHLVKHDKGNLARVIFDKLAKSGLYPFLGHEYFLGNDEPTLAT